MIELKKKCPNCNGKVKVVKMNNGMYFIKCTKCNFKDDFKKEDKSKVIEHWENKEQ